VDERTVARARLAVENNDAQGVNKATGRVCVLNILHTQGALDAHMLQNYRHYWHDAALLYYLQRRSMAAAPRRRQRYTPRRRPN
jgi:hypothetical protein